MFVRKLNLALALVLAFAGVASAQSPTRIQQFNAWGAYSYQAGAGKVCYVLSVPKEKSPANVDHGDIFFLVSQRPGQNISYEPQAMMGYPLQENSRLPSPSTRRTSRCSPKATPPGWRTLRKNQLWLPP